MLDTLDKITSILSSLTLILGSIYVIFSFKYKHDAEIRKMYMESYKKINNEIKSMHVDLTNNTLDSDKIINNIIEILNESELFLHYEVLNFIKNLKSKYMKRLYGIQNELDFLITEKIDMKPSKIDVIELMEDLIKLKNIYRKQITYDPWWIHFLNFISNSKQILSYISYFKKHKKEILQLLDDEDIKTKELIIP